MAKVYVTEFSGLYTSPNGLGQMARSPAIAEQTVAIGGGSTQSAAFNTATQIIRVHTDAICSVEIGTNPTATANTARFAANQTEYFGVQPGMQIAVITNS